MKQTFTSLTDDELKLLIKQCLTEVLRESGLLKIVNKKQEEDIMTVEEAAGFLNLALPTLYEKTSKKLIPHFKRDKKLYFKRSELEQWIDEGKVKTIPETEEEAKLRKLPQRRELRKSA